ncbi:aldehyde dehydrogenase family protein [Pseudobacteriovorax antillogorgiicola]|uniref:Acyl-CoA reductase n=1 Tax=Pseudobacteriovorax antillogorgiicola TaxID=1513793 RepID=A0A1Y6CN54_9BACT|nr:aldehyde dehydrogenase family protein [Pseudobacteriovorax antillogorgiicola]TCS44606.1 acyl-CoA reductase-like NAD-dependent aldehyde dehydrogenase [Pseudobacteriovorax antillogorgiicola]SMF78227.1 Acyl-CoA reductase [Pseudobacteriovorax antillogorgiicola]
MLSVINPATEELIKQLVTDTQESIGSKYQLCRQAQISWGQVAIEERKEIIEKFRVLLQDNADACARDTSLETGRPVHQVRNEIKATDARLIYFNETIEEVIKTQEVYRDETVREMVSWEPLGVIANISAWNYPYFVGTNVFVPALLAGNGVLYKPSEYASLTGQRLVELMLQAGLPENVMTPVIGDGQVGAMLMEQKIDGVFFTGSHDTGRKINEEVASRLVKVGFELGGKDPCYVTEDVDVSQAAAAVADGAFYNCGQSCCAVERVYVHEKIYDGFVAAFIEAVEGFKVGKPEDPSTYLGPLTRKEQIEVLNNQIADAVKQGATLQVGGNPTEGVGYYFEPTVLTEANHQMKLMVEESFGPIIGIQKVSSDQEAVELMNDTDYGLTASVYCRNLDRARNIMFHVHAGTVYTNCCDRVSPYTPWSGRGHSGLGSTLGRMGLETFLQPKAWHIKP